MLCRYGEAGLKNGMGGMGGADMGGFNNPFDLFEQVSYPHTILCLILVHCIQGAFDKCI